MKELKIFDPKPLKGNIVFDRETGFSLVSDKPFTWNDAINAMSAEEKAAIIASRIDCEHRQCYGGTCYKCILSVLNSPYDGRAQEGAE